MAEDVVELFQLIDLAQAKIASLALNTQAEVDEFMDFLMLRSGFNPSFTAAYAQLCKQLTKKMINFKVKLVDRCKKEFIANKILLDTIANGTGAVALKALNNAFGLIR